MRPPQGQPKRGLDSRRRIRYDWPIQMTREQILRQRIKLLTWLIIAGLVASGVTALPLPSEMDFITRLLGAADGAGPKSSLAGWLLKVRDGLNDAGAKYPFLAYGTDWLAFGHFVIALAFVGALRDPVRNEWLFTFGMLACALVVPFALVFGQVRGIPMGWRLLDCSFGAGGFVPLWLCRRAARELAAKQTGR